MGGSLGPGAARRHARHDLLEALGARLHVVVTVSQLRQHIVWSAA